MPVREDIIFRQDMVSYRGGGGRGGGSKPSSSNAGRVGQVVGTGTYEANDGGITRSTVQTMEAAVLTNPSGRDPNETNWLVELQGNINDLEQSWNNFVSDVQNIPDALGDAVSEGLEDGVNYMITGMSLMGRR